MGWLVWLGGLIWLIGWAVVEIFVLSIFFFKKGVMVMKLFCKGSK